MEIKNGIGRFENYSNNLFVCASHLFHERYVKIHENQVRQNDGEQNYMESYQCHSLEVHVLFDWTKMKWQMKFILFYFLLQIQNKIQNIFQKQREKFDQ
jgi:hypothetical protein